MSKELEELERIKNREILIDIEMTDTVYNECKDLHDSFGILEKALKAFDIIKDKMVDISWLINVCFCSDDGLFLYNEYHKRKPLTQEEYVLLREVLYESL